MRILHRTPHQIHTHALTAPRLLLWCLCSAALFLSSAVCPAQTCPSDEEPAGPESAQERLPDRYQPHYYDLADNTILRRVRFRPSGTGPWPTVLTLPPAVFRHGDSRGTPNQRIAAKDLIAAGFLVFQIEHRLAPDGLLLHQTRHTQTPAGIASGRPPQQTDDVKQQILAALADPDCNGKIFLIGGSSGGCHALWVALDSASGNVTDWTPMVRASIKGVVSLSGVTNLGSRVSDPDVDIVKFAVGVDNYTNVEEDDPQRYNKQYLKSPRYLVDTATNIPPIRLYATQEDSVPHQQAEDMYNALLAKGVDVKEYTMPGSEHCFNYWHMVNPLNNPAKCVSQEVIEFLNDQL